MPRAFWAGTVHHGDEAVRASASTRMTIGTGCLADPNAPSQRPTRSAASACGLSGCRAIADIGETLDHMTCDSDETAARAGKTYRGLAGTRSTPH